MKDLPLDAQGYNAKQKIKSYYSFLFTTKPPPMNKILFSPSYYPSLGFGSSYHFSHVIRAALSHDYSSPMQRHFSWYFLVKVSNQTHRFSRKHMNAISDESSACNAPLELLHELTPCFSKRTELKNPSLSWPIIPGRE